MKKFIIPIVIFLMIVFTILLFTLNIINKSSTSINFEKLENTIEDNSKWIELSSEDFNSLLLGNYSSNILAIINSLEESIPVILQISDSKFSSDKEPGTFIVATCFDKDNNVYFYTYNQETSKYTKKLSSLNTILESATAVFILQDTEVLK